MADLVHRMGGSIRKDFSAKITNLIANSTSGEKYRVCTWLIYHFYPRRSKRGPCYGHMAGWLAGWVGVVTRGIVSKWLNLS